jgi:hypothetical protein
MESFTSHMFYSRGKKPHYPLDGRLDGCQNQSGRVGEVKESNPCASPRRLVTLLTELPRL